MMMRLMFLGAAMLAAACTPGGGVQSGPATEELTLVGTEPFWGVEITQLSKATIFTRPDHPAVTATLPERTVKGGVETLTAKAADGELKMVLRKATCSDGMSDRAYPYEVEVSWKGETFKGCGILTAEFAKGAG